MMQSPEPLYESEFPFNKSDIAKPPRFGVCFSGGGNRSAAFAIGVLWALHEAGLLKKVDVVSAVSGGTYALSWFLLQPFYQKNCHADPKVHLGQVQKEMFDPAGLFQRYLSNNAKPLEARSLQDLTLEGAIHLVFDV